MMPFFPEWKAEHRLRYVFCVMIHCRVIIAVYIHAVRELAMQAELHLLPWMD